MSRIKDVLVPIDFSGSADSAFDYAVDLALRYGATLHLLHVLEDPSLIGGYPDGFVIDPPGLRTRMFNDAARLLEQAMERCTRMHVAATTQVLFGRPAAAIVQLAIERGSDLIVMGTHGRSGFAHFMLGSVAERVVRSAPCPVLTVRDKILKPADEPVIAECVLAHQ